MILFPLTRATILLAAGVFSFDAAEAVAAQRRLPAIVSFIETDTGERGGGLLLRTGSGCGVLTAAHVVAGASSISIVTSTGLQRFGELRRLDNAADIAIIEIEAGDRLETVSCQQTPSSEHIDFALQNGPAQIFVPTATGQISLVSIEVIGITTEEIRIRAVGAPGFTRGMSGSPVIASGIPVAILNSVDGDNGTARARRLDHSARLLGQRFIMQPEESEYLIDSDRFVAIINNGSRSEKERAILAGLASPDELLRSLALRHSLCSQREIVISFAYPSGTDSNYNSLRSQTVAFQNQNCDPELGGAELIGPTASNFGHMGNVGTLTIDGERAIIVAEIPIQANTPSSQCRFLFRFDGGNNMIGSMACSGYWGPFGPTSASMSLR